MHKRCKGQREDGERLNKNAYSALVILSARRNAQMGRKMKRKKAENKNGIKVLFYLVIVAAGCGYFLTAGIKNLIGFFTLGTKEADAWSGTAGDDSVVMLLMGIFTWIVLALFIWFIKAGFQNIRAKKQIGIKAEIRELLDKKFYKTVLFVPILGVCIFNIIPIIFMILIAFTNYGGTIVPPKLVDWVGPDNFIKLATLSRFAPTFFRILLWNVVWAVLATALNFFGGLFLALLMNKKCVKGKAFWRSFPVFAYATPGFITLLAFKFMFSYGGPINQIITEMGYQAVGFLDLDAKWMARLIGLLVNAWISIPSIMLLATGMLSNMDETLFEAARIDGAGRWRQFKSITMPFILFSTTPVIISQFIGNFNNFGIFYFLRGGLNMEGYFLASDTDLLINWLYNMSIANNYYAIGAAISLIIFMITALVSLVVYMKSPSYREEETFQ